MVARKGGEGELLAQLWLENPNGALLGEKCLKYNEMTLLKRILEKCNGSTPGCSPDYNLTLR
jgi:hypothetical protein